MIWYTSLLYIRCNRNIKQFCGLLIIQQTGVFIIFALLWKFHNMYILSSTQKKKLYLSIAFMFPIARYHYGRKVCKEATKSVTRRLLFSLRFLLPPHRPFSQNHIFCQAHDTNKLVCKYCICVTAEIMMCTYLLLGRKTFIPFNSLCSFLIMCTCKCLTT